MSCIATVFDIGNDPFFSFSVGVPSVNCLASVPECSGIKSVNPDAEIVIAGIDAYFSDNRSNANEVLYCSYQSVDSYKADMYIYSTESTMLTGAIYDDEGVTVYKVKLLEGWNRVLKVKKDNLILITNGENKDAEWRLVMDAT